MTAVGAGLSLVILVGVVTWAYRLGVRDATDIPVIRAEAGLTRVRPEDPGGQVAPHQERAVFEAVTGSAPVQPVETAPLAPPPETLAEEDVAPVALAPEPEARPEAPAAPEAAAPGDAAALTEDAAGPAADAETSADPLAAAVEAAVAEALAAAPSSEEAVDSPSEDAGDGAPRFAPVAAPRPSAAAAAASAPSARPAPPGADAVAASAVQIQLGAFESEAVAESQWAAIRGGNADLLGSLGRAITPVQSGGRTLWRLRAGPFESIGEAAALCRALSLRRQDCIVARAR
ncbi:MAG: SPOR domain-containing protein [Pikeienuella sp.]|uniref:SPOR domain-containing protein n=1 Tax=Pikeienuella sp. TaxID=2831957 RepID=UPI00391A35BD